MKKTRATKHPFTARKSAEIARSIIYDEVGAVESDADRIAIAQVHATLAVAEELRTLNLTKLMGRPGSPTPRDLGRRIEGNPL